MSANIPPHGASLIMISAVLPSLFFQLAPKVKTDLLHKLLKNAWEKDSLSTLRIIWQARSIHEGKGIRDEIFYSCLACLYANHPRTLCEK